MKLRNDAEGVLLFDRVTGINVLLDEVPVNTIDLAPRHISIALTNKCNLSCPHCYINHESVDLEYSRVESWLRELDDNGCLSVGFGGGEPTLWSDLLRAFEYVKIHTEMASTITTNGSASEDAYIEIQQVASLIRFSLDGLFSTYEKSRNQSFNSILNKIRSARKRGNIGINYLINDNTVLQLNDLKEIIQDLGEIEVLILPEIGKDKNINLSESSINSLNEWISEMKDTIQINFSFSGLNILKSSYLPIQSYSDIDQHKYFMHITARGELSMNVFDDNKVYINDSLIDGIQNKRSMK